MLNFTRKKRVTDPFDEHARARVVGADHRQVASGSEHSGDEDPLSLSYLVNSFLEQNTNASEDSPIDDDSDRDRVDSVDDSLDSLSDSPSLALALALSFNADPYRTLLLAHVSEAAEKFAFLRDRNASLFRRHVAAFLIERRHDAAVCETARDTVAGSHEFIDVVRTDRATWRYFVDPDFRAQFEIARPTRRFAAELDSVPGVFVGDAGDLKRTISTVCEAARRCFRSRGLAVPPWRKNRLMQKKWLGAYRRIIANAIPRDWNGVSCRFVGFDDVVLDAGRVGRTR